MIISSIGYISFFQCSGTPPYENPVNTTTSLLELIYPGPKKSLNLSFSYLKKPFNTTIPLIRPIFHGLKQSSQVDLLTKSEIFKGVAVVSEATSVTPLGGTGGMLSQEFFKNGSSPVFLHSEKKYDVLKATAYIPEFSFYLTNGPFSEMAAENSNRSILKTYISTRKNTFSLVTLPSFSTSGEISAEKM